MNDVLFLGDRQMQRLFKSHRGLTPKAYFKLMRFRQACDRSRAARRVDWIGLATLLGYSDQAHVIRDLKCYAGATPQAFLQQPRPPCY